MVEREAKFIVAGRRGLPPPDKLLEGLGDVSIDTIDQDAVYFDTEDLRLTRAGASLRYRSDDGWTVKLPVTSGSELAREELSFGGEEGEEPPEAAAGFVRALTRAERLRPVARIRTHRRRARLIDAHGRLVGELDDDDVLGIAGSGSVSAAPLGAGVQFHEVEFEVADDARAKTVAKVLQRLRDAGAEPDENRSKVSRVLGEAAQMPPDLPTDAPLGEGATVEDLARACLLHGARRLVLHDPVVRAGEDPEGVHQARVATRRLRADLRTLRPVLDSAWSEPLRDELRWIGTLLGRVRDADVLAELLRTHSEALAPEKRHQAAHLFSAIHAERADALETLLAAMGSTRYAALLDRLIEGVHRPHLRESEDAAAESLDRAAEQLLAKPWKRLRQQIRRLPPQPTDADLHEARKRAKHARYALEAMAPLLDKSARRAAKRLAELQDVLGDHQDAVIAAEWLDRNATAIGDVATAFVCGALAQSFATDRRALRDKWPPIWEQARHAYRRAIE